MQSSPDNRRMINRAIRLTAVVTLSFLVILIFLIFFFNATGYAGVETGYLAVDGVLDLTDYDIDRDDAVEFRGEWDFLPGYYFGDRRNASLPEAMETVTLPMRRINDAEIGGTYRLTVRTGSHRLNSMALYLPYDNESFSIYVDRKLITSNDPSVNDHDFVFSKFLYYTEFPDLQEEHEILVVTSRRPGEGLFYDATLTFGNRKRITEHVVWNWAKSFFVTGIFAALLVQNLVFVMLRPEHKTITRLAIYDSILIIRLILGISELYYLVYTVAGQAVFSARMLADVQFSALILSGIAGCFLAEHLFHPGKMGKVTIVICALLGALCVIFLLPMPWLTEPIKGVVLLAVLAVATVNIGRNVVATLKRTPTPYYVIQTILTALVLIFMAGDILHLFAFEMSYQYLIYLYTIILLAHVVLRLMDNNDSYRMVEILNHDLERVVQERTQQLMEANRRLSEISVRDALTGAYNRLYFERHMEATLGRWLGEGTPVHLAIFDLDLFKRINDTYGHDAGDRVLARVVQIVTDELVEGMTLARIGGEEFAIIVVDRPSHEVIETLETIREAIAAERREIWTTASFGVAALREGMDYRALFRAADRCLYAAKNGGRNRVEADFLTPAQLPPDGRGYADA